MYTTVYAALGSYEGNKMNRRNRMTERASRQQIDKTRTGKNHKLECDKMQYTATEKSPQQGQRPKGTKRLPNTV